ncbi:MAG TPA: S-layer homology domain-containing protein [Limnochordia bacterium]|nr:S-layer homology domain-containing protein [Limnochordia bacterium]
MKTGRLMLILCLAVALTIPVVPGAAAGTFSDIGSSWAREHIEALAELGIVRGYPDQTFRPNRPITRAEFAKMATMAFTIIPEKDVSFSDLDGHWAREAILALAGAGIAEGFPSGAFRPDDKLTRAEAVSMLVRILKLGDVGGYTETPSFVDVPPHHWAFASIETALRLKLLPPYIRGNFEPSLPVTRAETAAMIHESLRLQVTRGTVDYLDPRLNMVGVRHQGGVSDFTLHPETIIFRNTTVAPIENLEAGDAILVVADRFGSPQFVKANGVITPSDVVTKVSNVTRGLLTPSDLRAIIAGDWDAVADSLKSVIYDELVKRGLTPVEAAAVMNRDWDSLRAYAKDHLAQVIGEFLGISADLAIAVLDRDWERARELAQVEAVEQLLGGLLLEEPA